LNKRQFRSQQSVEAGRRPNFRSRMHSVPSSGQDSNLKIFTHTDLQSHQHSISSLSSSYIKCESFRHVLLERSSSGVGSPNLQQVLQSPPLRSLHRGQTLQAAEIGPHYYINTKRLRDQLDSSSTGQQRGVQRSPSPFRPTFRICYQQSHQSPYAAKGV